MFDFSVTLGITVINIAVLSFILRAVLFKPVTKFMAERARRVQDSIDMAETEKAAAQNLLAEYQGLLKKADTEAGAILLNAREDADREAKRIIAEGKEAAAVIVGNARKKFEAERQTAIAKFEIEAAALVVAAAARLAQREMLNDGNKKYAGMLLDELAAQKRNL